MAASPPGPTRSGDPPEVSGLTFTPGGNAANQFYSSNTFYVGYAGQSAWDTAATAATHFLRCDRAGSSAEWQQNVETLRIGYGDIYGDTDTEVINPIGQITIRHPLTKTTLNDIWTLCGIAQGATYAGIGNPQNVTLFIGQGGSEDVYFNAQIQRVRISVAKARNQQRAMVDFTFAAGDIKEAQTPPQTVAQLNTGVLKYERPYHLAGLKTTTLLGTTTESTTPAAKIESVQVDLVWTNPAQYLGRSDGKDRVSDFAWVDFGATVQIQRSFNNTQERKQYLLTCANALGALELVFTDVCDAPNQFGIVVPKGRYTVGRITAPDRDFLHEALTVQALRSLSNPSSQAVGGSDGTQYSPIGFKFS